MSSFEFEVGGQKYRATKLDALRQFQLSRKLAPIVPKLIPVFAKLAENGEKALTQDIAGFSALLQPFADAVSDMSDANAEYVLSTCMSVVQRRQPQFDSWAPVWSQNTTMFADIDLGVMLVIAFAVVRDNLGNFIVELLLRQSKGESEQKAPTG